MPQNPEFPADEFTAIEVTITDRVMFPKGSTIVIAPTGVTTAVKLPDGSTIKPWITYELEGDEEYSDLTHAQLTARNVHAEQHDKEIAEL